MAVTASAQEFTLGSPAVGIGVSLDGWNSNMVIREEAIYVNNSGDAQDVTGVEFEVGIGNNRARVTPFIVQINDLNGNGDFTDDNDFIVLSIGTTRVSGIDYTEAGVTTFAYSNAPEVFSVPDGAAIGAAYMDCDPDGFGGEAGSVVSFDGGAPVGSMWYAGNAGTTHPNPIAIDTVLSGAPAAGVENRNYHFSIKVSFGPLVDGDGDGLPATFEEMFDFLSDDNPDDADADEDMDFSTNLEEYIRATNLEDPDSDDDLLLDGHETDTGTWVSATDTGTNPKLADSDSDGLRDGVENNDGMFVSPEQTGTDPNLEDSDADTWGDAEEINLATDPSDPQSFPEGAVMGTPEILPTGGVVDGWRSNLIIDEGRSYLNESGGSQVIRPTIFRCRIGNVRARVTPFIVRLNDVNMDGNFFDDNDFTIMAIGTTRVAGTDYTAQGRSSFVFDENDGTFELAAGERIAAAYIDADPDGTNGGDGSVIPFGGAVPAGEMWYNGQSAEPHPSPPAPLEVGGAMSGAPAANVDNRNYLFQALFEIGAGPPLQITSIDYDNGSVTVTWNSKANGIYAVDYSGDLSFWTEQTDDTPSEGEETSYTFPAGGFPDPASFTRMYVRVRDVSP